MIWDSWIWRRSNGVYIRKTYSAITHSHTNILFLFLVFFCFCFTLSESQNNKGSAHTNATLSTKTARTRRSSSKRRRWESTPIMAFSSRLLSKSKQVCHSLPPIPDPNTDIPIPVLLFSNLRFCWSRVFFFFLSLESVWILWKCKLLRDAKENRVLDLRNDDFLFPFLTDQTVR